MIDNAAALLALRSYLLASLVVCRSVDGDVAAVATGYTSTLANFVTLGFKPGMEVQPTGFLTTTSTLITGVTASTLTTFDAVTPDVAASGKTIAVGVPNVMGWENITVNPPANRWMFAEDYLPGPVAQVTLGPHGAVESLPQYVLKLYGVAGYGPEAMYAVADAVLDVFAPRTVLAVAATDQFTVRTSPAPYRGQLTQYEPGRPVIVVTVPLRLRSTNSL